MGVAPRPPPSRQNFQSEAMIFSAGQISFVPIFGAQILPPKNNNHTALTQAQACPSRPLPCCKRALHVGFALRQSEGPDQSFPGLYTQRGGHFVASPHCCQVGCWIPLDHESYELCWTLQEADLPGEGGTRYTIVFVFPPHLYNRVEQLAKQWDGAISGMDLRWVPRCTGVSLPDS